MVFIFLAYFTLYNGPYSLFSKPSVLHPFDLMLYLFLSPPSLFYL